jgi:predicted RNA-binding protein with PIN domain
MGSHVIVDGYNLIGASPRYRSEREKAMEIAREALIEDLRRYKQHKGLRITVVFDGTFTHHINASKSSYKGIQIIYSRATERADDVIVRMAEAAPHGTVVVSSDLEVVQKCRRLGAAAISAQDFEDRLMLDALTEMKGTLDEEGSEPNVSTKKKGPSRRPSKSQRKNRQRLDRL